MSYDLFEEYEIEPAVPSVEAPKVNPFLERLQKLSESNAVSAINKFGERLAPFAGGLLQGGLESGASALNLGLAPFGKHVESPNLRQYLPNTLGTDVGFGAGEILGELAGFGAASKGLGALGSAIHPGRISGKAGLLANALKNAGAGYITGENSPVGREGSAALAAALSPLSYSSNKNIAERVLSDKAAAQELYGQKYGNLFRKVEESGIGKHLEPPKLDVKHLLKKTTTNTEKLKDFMSNPTVETAHRAQSELKSIIRGLEKTATKKGGVLTSSQKKVLDQAKVAKDDISGYMKKAFEQYPSGTLAPEYEAITKGYASEVAPYFKKPIAEYQKTGLSPEKLVRGLSVDDYFQKEIGQMYPEIQLRMALEALKGPAKTTAAAGLALGGAHEAYKNLNPGVNR